MRVLHSQVKVLVLATAPLIGWISVVLDQKTNETLNDILVALLAGVMLYAVFERYSVECYQSTRVTS